MSIKIAGMGWVTPLGTSLQEVYDGITLGTRAAIGELANPVSGVKHPYIPIPKGVADAVGRNPRLRRSSSISYYTATAGLAALENAEITMDAPTAERTAVIFAITSGGVIYSRKFYETIVNQGANAASPLLFPETVYNAPASHLSALLGITGMSYTLVGDASVGISALKFAEQLLESEAVDQCVVVGGEEVDWVLCEAYRKLRLTSPRGMILAEGAAALVLKREGSLTLERIHDGIPFFTRKEADPAIQQVVEEMVPGADLVVSSANGTFIDALEAKALAKQNLPVVYPKQSLGEAQGASALMQTIHAALALQRQSLKAVAVSCLGLNQQASGVRISARL